MKLERLFVNNYNGFKDQSLGFKDITFLIGPNGTGKSKILDVFKLINNYIKNDYSYDYDNLFDRIVYDQNTRLMIRILFDFVLSDRERNSLIDRHFDGAKNEEIKDSKLINKIRYRLDFDKNGIKNAVLRISNFDSGLVTIVSRTRTDDSTSEIRNINLVSKISDLTEFTNFKWEANQVSISGTDMNQILNYDEIDPLEKEISQLVRSFFLSIKWFDPFRQITSSGRSTNLIEVSSDGSNIVSVMRTLSAEDPYLYVDVSDQIGQTIPFIERSYPPSLNGDNSLQFSEEGLQKRIGISNMSTGIQQVSTLVTGIHTSNDPSLILLEEPEAHQHASTQRKLRDFFIEKSKDTQFLIATHSPLFTGCTSYCTTVLLTKDQGLSTLKQLQYDELHLVRNLMGHRNADMYFDEVIVFIEGESEYVLLPIIFNKLGYDLNHYGIKLLNVKGKDNFLKIEKGLECLKSSDIMPYVIADGNKKVKNRLDSWIKDELIPKNNYTIWDKEIEDIFEKELVIMAFNQWLDDNNVDERIDIAYIEDAIKPGDSIIKGLSRFLHENNLPRLDKPALIEYISEVFFNQPNEVVENSEIVNVVRQIVATTESKYET